MSSILPPVKLTVMPVVERNDNNEIGIDAFGVAAMSHSSWTLRESLRPEAKIASLKLIP